MHHITRHAIMLLIAAVAALSLLGSAAPAAADEHTPGVPADVIAEYPEPNVRPLRVNESLLYDRVYRRVNGAAQRYDGPGGSVTGTLDAGFNFVTVHQFADGWAQTARNVWMRADQLTDDVPISRFAGVLLPDEPLPYTMAWTLVNLYPSRTPGGDTAESNPFMYRYTRVNIYDEVEIDGWRWYQVGVDQWVKQIHVAKILPVARLDDIDTERWISIDLYEQVLIAYEGEMPVFATLISSGLPDWNTREGLFNIYLRYPRAIMSGAHNRPEFYYLEEVPWTMYFDGEIAVHGVYWHDGFGYRRSRGCVNMTITDAHWLYEWADTEFDLETERGAAVYVYSSGEYR
jgi:hypothetical protein